MSPAGFGWSVGDVIRLIEISVVVYKAFIDARRNSSRQLGLLTEKFERFHRSFELLRSLVEEHNKTFTLDTTSLRPHLKIVKIS